MEWPIFVNLGPIRANIFLLKSIDLTFQNYSFKFQVHYIHYDLYVYIQVNTYTGVADCLKDIAKMSAMFSILHKHI